VNFTNESGSLHAHARRELINLEFSRRLFLGTTLAGLASALARPALPWSPTTGRRITAGLVQRAMAALEQHRDRIAFRDVVGIADFSLPSSAPRFHLLSLVDGGVTSFLVAHGRGSDPGHTGWLERFSNQPHSYATSSGAYLTDGHYVGGHGPSIRLDGLDVTNSNAASRAIVVHGAWYVSEQMVGRYGMLGRSEGCFAVAQPSLDEILSRLGPGRLIYADKA
jgi:hypothetical protein